MITAIDTNILLDIFLPDHKFGPASRNALARQFSKGSLTICDIVYAELSAFFESEKMLEHTLVKLGVRFSGVSHESAYKAGCIWRRYMARSGKKRRVLADFIIGAHAQEQTDALLTRDRGFYKDYFSHLTVLAP